ncbi:MAG: glycolate oxidase subunit GlcE [Burkholderiales bacterium]
MLDELRERVREAAGRRSPLRLRGGGSKDFYGGAPRGEVLDTRSLAGIVDYEPTELVVTARCGTPLAALEAALAERGQMLPFEPPHFGAGATLGGCVATGLSGPRRAAAGAVRDFVLGARLLDGRARELAVGGRVMKNVAGFDVARLLAGSLGTLGVILEVSLKVLPRPAAEATLRLAMPQAKAIEALNLWGGQPLPLTASAWRGGELSVRLSGSEAAVRAAAARIGGDPLAGAEAFWRGIREHTDAFFAGDVPLWRLSVPSTAAPFALEGEPLLEWGGALRWLRTGADVASVRAETARAGGHATLFRDGDKSAGVFAPLGAAALRLHRELKAAFDPAGILNPGRLHPDF